jgi:hypothetical protein
VRRFVIILILWLLSSVAAAQGPGYGGGFDGSVQVALGQHFTGKICAPTFFPFLEFRFGHAVSRDYTLRLDLGTALTRIAESDRSSFEGATFMLGHFSLVFLYTPEVSKSFRLNLGSALGLWFAAMWGEDLMGTMAGSVQKYLEALSISYAAVAGAEWDLSDGFALFFEARGNLALAKFGREYNTGGVTVLAGILFRVRSSGP